METRVVDSVIRNLKQILEAEVQVPVLLASVLTLGMSRFSLWPDLGLSILTPSLPYVAIIAIVSFSIIVGGAVSSWMRRCSQSFHWRRIIKKQAQTLTEEEKSVLRQFVDGDRAVLQLDMARGVGPTLEDKHFIHRASSISAGGTVFPYAMQPIARTFLRKHPALIAESLNRGRG